jgi:hypothetical protein
MILIKHDDGLFSRYSHLQPIPTSRADIKLNAPVSKSQVIGFIGNTGSSTGAHLDLKVYTSDPRGTTAASTVNPLCIYDDEALSEVTFASIAKSCTKNRYKEPFSRSDPVLAEECKHAPSFQSAPACSIVTDATPAQLRQLELTQERLAKSPGMRVVQDAAQEAGIDARLLIAIIAQESGGDATILNSAGAVGLGQFLAASSTDHRLRGAFKGAANPVCKCPVPEGKTGLVSCHATDDAVRDACKDDPRVNPEQSVIATARYLRALHDVFSKYADGERFAIAAYNRGEGTIQNAIKEVGLENPRWEDIAPKIASEGQQYVPKVMTFYVAQGGATTTQFGDQECGGITVKEIGTYTFLPTIKTTLPNLFTALDRVSAGASSARDACASMPDAPLCVVDRLRSGAIGADLSLTVCDGANESLVFGLAEAIEDCSSNDACGCSWSPPVTAEFEEVRIDVHGDAFQVSGDGAPLQVIPATLNKEWGEEKGMYLKGGSVQFGTVSYVLQYKDSRLSRIEQWIDDVRTEMSVLQFRNAAEGIVWLTEPATLCAPQKQTYRYCLTSTQSLYVLSQKKDISPVIRFAMDVKDELPPTPSSIPEVDFGTKTVRFTPSASPDIAYYRVRCALDGPDPFAGVIVQAREPATVAGKPISSVLSVNFEECNGRPLLPSQKVSVIPVDLVGNEGTAATCDPQSNSRITDITGALFPQLSILQAISQDLLVVACPLEVP